jgi:hypothetical protein
LSDERDNGWAPREEMRFEPVRDRYGWRLALVFGNHSSGGVCPFYAGDLCNHCDIGAGEGVAFDHTMNRRRIAWFADHYRWCLDSINHLVLYNSGSVLNPREMPPDSLDEIVTFARSLPAVRIISLDSREAYIRLETLRRIVAVAGERITVRPILGLESSDDRIRNEILRKAMPRAAVIRVFRDLGILAVEYGADRIGLDVNIVVGGPGTTPDTAVADAAGTALFSIRAGAEHGVRVDLNLHPYYSGARGLARFPDQGRCSIATAGVAASVIVGAVRSSGAPSNIFIGWQDEGHDFAKAERSLELKRTRTDLDQFNQTNEPRLLLESQLT